MSRLGALTPANAIGAAWAWHAASRARRQLRRGGLRAVSLPKPPRLGAWRGVRVVLNRRKLTCVERSAVRQRWLTARGSPRDLIVGVDKQDDDFVMHAWLEGDAEERNTTFTHLLRHEGNKPIQS
jgi:hypothetical protein